MAALAKLVYSPFIELLHGTVGTKEVLVWAASGGSRGSTDKKRWKETKASYDPKKAGSLMPPGTYKIYWLGKYQHFGRCCWLEPSAEIKKFMIGNGRKWNDLLIHGPGPKGSDGCLVPHEKADYKKLMDLLSGSKNEYRGVLVVENDSNLLLSD